MSRIFDHIHHSFAGFSPRRRVSLILLVLAALTAIASPATAYWRTSGSGSGSATTGTMTFQVVALLGGDESTALGAQSTTLVPGGSADAILRVTNPNAFAVKVTAISAGTATASGTCNPASVTFTNPSVFTAGQYTLNASATSLLALPSAVLMSSGAQQNCMGATFTFPVTVTVQK